MTCTASTNWAPRRVFKVNVTIPANLLWLPDDAFPTAFAQNASADDLTVLAAVQRPLRFSCMTVPTTGDLLWKKVPTWYLLAEHDRMVVPATQRFMAERMKATIKIACRRSHPDRHGSGTRGRYHP